MKLLYLPLFSVLLLSSCSVFERGEYTPLYLQKPSPLDPPGTAEAREQMRQQRVKEGIFAVGATPEVQQGKAFLLDRNPDYTPDPKGRMVTTGTVKVLSCEGTYYFVEAENGKRGFLRETDMVNPVTLVSTVDVGPLPTGEGILPLDGGVLPFEQARDDQGADTRLRTNKDGRTVVIVGKKTEKNEEFEARKRALESGRSLDGVETAVPVTPADDADEPLPEPSGSQG
ncbi:MAG: hypothetical protein Q4F38_04540 [Akkermansia sp.]|nr:hypothetical protein [Akkermansia sp.]